MLALELRIGYTEKMVNRIFGHGMNAGKHETLAALELAQEKLARARVLGDAIGVEHLLRKVARLQRCVDRNARAAAKKAAREARR